MSPISSGGRSIAALSQERDELLASLADLEREHAAGDFEESDYAQLRARYTKQAAKTLRALDLARQQPEVLGNARPFSWRGFRRFLGRRRTRRSLVLGAIVCFVGLVALLVASFSGVRLFGQQLSGSVSIPSSAAVRQQLSEAAVLGSEGQLNAAVALYNAVLDTLPEQPEALTYKGWLERLSGIAAASAHTVKAGDVLIAQAVRVAPSYPDARAFDGVALLEDDNNVAGAVKQFKALLEDKPSANLLRGIGPNIASAFQKDHQVLPAAVRADA